MALQCGNGVGFAVDRRRQLHPGHTQQGLAQSLGQYP